MAGYGMNPSVSSWLEAMGGGLPGEEFPIMARSVKLYHRHNIGIGGDAPTRLRFYNETAQNFVQTIVSSNVLPANMGLAITSIRFGFVAGLDRLGRRLGLNAPSAAQKLLSSMSGAAAAAAGGLQLPVQARWPETIREFLATPIVTFGLSTDELWTVSGLTAFPDGKGSLVQGWAAAAQSGTTPDGGIAEIAQSLTNGAPVQSNKWPFAQPWPIAGNETFKIEVLWPRAVDFADPDIGPLAGEEDVIAGTLTCELDGVLGVASS